MTQASRTPGPWSLVDDEWDGIFVHAPQSHKFVCEVTVTNPVYTTPGYDISKEEALANARFIAAAPELLEQAEFTDEEIGKHMAAIEAGEYAPSLIVEILRDIQNQARTTIAKVTGEERTET